LVGLVGLIAKCGIALSLRWSWPHGRASYLNHNHQNIHHHPLQYFGSAILALAVGAALMGHLEKQLWANKEYSKGNGEALLVNWTGLLLVLSALGTTLLLR
jgi:hypothetical protein